MPLNYGSQISEHLAVRKSVGIFDVSHMIVTEIEGKDATKALLRIFANNVNKLNPYQAQYTTMLDEKGGIIDDLIVYCLFKKNQIPRYRVIHNASRAKYDIDWIKQQLATFKWKCDFRIIEDIAIIAIQGPNSLSLLRSSFSEYKKNLVMKKFFTFEDCKNGLMISRTGYTGEDGYEIILPIAKANKLWQDLIKNKAQPCGLGARDSLRLEAGFPLYGNELSNEYTPYESGIGWSVDLSKDRDFIGRKALGKTPGFQIQGLLLNSNGVLRASQKINQGIGWITSGGYSPIMKKSIALSRLPISINTGDEVDVEIRNQWLKARVVNPPFVREGKILVK